MPTYTYQCGACAHRFDAVQSIHDDAMETCPECGGALRKVFGSVGVAFKGSGFYRTDSRSDSKPASKSRPSGEGKQPTSSPSPSPSSGTA